MKILKKAGLFLAAACMLILGPVIRPQAADGALEFSDPTGKVGEEIEVKVKISTGGAAIGDGDVTVTYDQTKLEYVSGTNVTGGDGTLDLFATGDGTVSELNYVIVFKALEEGTATLAASGYTAYLYNNETLNLTQGTSTVTIEAGDGTAEESESGTGTTTVSGEADIEINGTKYASYNDFSDALIPEGCSRTTLSYNGSDRTVIQMDATGQYIFYLVTGENDPVMALYNESDGTFALTEMVSVSDTGYVLLLGTNDGTGLPSQFRKTELSVGGLTFPAWENSEDGDFYLIYALNSSGNEGFYQYDTQDGTYQRYPVSETTGEDNKSTSIVDRAVNFIKDQIVIVMAVVWGLILLLLIFIIVLAVKLRNRNEELDDLYEEQEQRAEPQKGRPAVAKKSREQFARYRDEEDSDADLYDNEYENEPYEEDEFDDEEDDGEFEDYEEEESEETEYYEEEEDGEYEDDDYEEFDDYEDEYDDYEEDEEVSASEKKSSKKKKEDDFSMDFIDL